MSGRGVFATGPVDIATAAVADLVFSDQRTSIWIRMAEYPILPRIGDQIVIPPILNLPGGSYRSSTWIRSPAGKVVLTLKKPPQ